MSLARKQKPLLLLNRVERCQPTKKRCCLRTECIVSALLVGMLAMFVTWGSSSIVKAGYELVQARASLTKLEKQNELLRMEMARLKSPQRIQEIATGQLGMIKPLAVYVAANETKIAKSAKDGLRDAVATRSTVVFGNARAEAHQLKTVSSR